MSTLHRHIAIGETLSFDDGRIVVTLQDRTGRSASLRLELADDVRVDKPSEAWVHGGRVRTPLANAKA
ncbi:MAG: hypothetical protein I8H71_01185 [Xanthomonadaceae bacterium]|nr:hypothetical protein [Xanthomonadaceae bacterium]